MSVYEEVTHSVLAELENDTPPWIKHWQPHLPHNLVSKREYRGVNVFLLWSRGFTSPYWLTSRQARALGGHIKKGSKATCLACAANGRMHGEALGDEDENGSLTWSPAFNVEQTEGIPIPQVEDKQPRDAMDAQRDSNRGDDAGTESKNLLAGAWNALTGKLLTVTGERKNRWLFIELLAALSRAYPATRYQRLYVVVDNYSIHKEGCRPLAGPASAG